MMINHNYYILAVLALLLVISIIVLFIFNKPETFEQEITNNYYDPKLNTAWNDIPKSWYWKTLNDSKVEKKCRACEKNYQPTC